MLKGLKLRERLMLANLIPVALSVVVAVVVFQYARSASRVTSDVHYAYDVLDNLKDIAYSLTNMQRTLRGYMIAKNEDSLKRYEQSKDYYKERSDRLKALVKDPGQKERLTVILEKGQATQRFAEGLVTLVRQGKTDAAIETFKKGEGVRLAEEVEKAVAEFIAGEKEILDKRLSEQEGAFSYLTVVILFGTLFSIILIFAIGYFISGGIARSLGSATSSVSSTATELSSAIIEHEKVANSQAAMVSQTTATVDELGASARQTTEQASSASAVAEKAMHITVEGQERVREAVLGMNSLKEKISRVAEEILKLSEQTAQIGGLADIVRDIAGQTNMLALNAAVEAVRAGEHGKGFGVLAAEVRKLADQSKKSAEQANELVAEIQKATNSTIMVTEEGQKTVEGVLGVAGKVGEMFDGLKGSAGKVYENAQQVLLNSRQQATALGQVVTAINNINAGAKETAAGLTQTRAGVERLNDAAKGLKEIA